MKLAKSQHLTEGYTPEVALQIKKSHVGMASWAATGPFGATCRECKHYGTWKQTRDAAGNAVKTTFLSGRCDMFRQLVGKIGAAVPSSAEACRHFVRKT
jgi:hypothetical protein